MVGYAHDMEIDAAGRVLLPPMLKKFAGLDKSAVLVGQGTKIEIWDEARWEAQVAQALNVSDDDMPVELEGFTL
jgi:MraZ protein